MSARVFCDCGRNFSTSDRTRLNRDLARECGFTLIELLVVMVIIGLLGALVMPRLFKNVGKSKVRARKGQMASFQTALGAYKLAVGVSPATDEGLQALRSKPASATKWDGPYLPKEIPADPWG